MKNTQWQKTISALVTSTWLYMLSFITGHAFLGIGWMEEIFVPVGHQSDLLHLAERMTVMCVFLMIIGYLLCAHYLLDFSRLQLTEAGRKSVLKIRQAYFLSIIPYVIGFLPYGEIVRIVLLIVVYWRLIGGYRELQRFSDLPEKACHAAGRLRVANIGLLIIQVIGIIPLIGNVLACIAGVFFLLMFLSAWKEMRQGEPVLESMSEAEVETLNVPLFLYCILGIFGYNVLYECCTFAMMAGWVSTTAVSIFVNLLWVCGFCWMRYNRNLQLPKISRVGLLLLIVTPLLQAQIWWDDVYAISQYSGLFSYYYLFIKLAGMMLLVLPLSIGKVLKAYVLLYPVFVFIIRPLLYRLVIVCVGMSEEVVVWGYLAVDAVRICIAIVFFLLVWKEVRKNKCSYCY